MRDKQTPIVHSNGINKNNILPNSSDVSFALNAIRVSTEGRAEYQSEPGNQISISLPSGYLPVGSVYGQNEEVYIFSTNETSSEIGLFKQDKYTTLANLDLGFSSEFPISGEYRMRNGCERCLYWTDYNNVDYYFNVDKPNDFKTSNVFDSNKFKFNPDIQVPKIDLKQVNSSGGALPLGSYYFQLEIVDKNGNSFYKSDITPQTIIYDDDQSDSYNKIDGGLNAPQYDPAIGGLPATNKSITLEFSNLDTSFSYLQVNVIRQIAANNQTDAHAVGQLIPIADSTLTWTYTGYNVAGGDYEIDYTSVLVPNVKYSKSYCQELVQGRLVRANVQQDNPDYSQFQKEASKITAKWVAKEVPVNDTSALGDPKNPLTYWYNTSYQGDEIYEFGIQYLLQNGDYSPVFPLIGRTSVFSDTQSLTVVANAVTPTSTEVWESDVKHLGLSVGDTVPKWKVFNTASITDSQTVTHPYNYTGEFGFYESDNSTYPDIQDCDGNYIWGFDSMNNQINPTTKLRFFRFPDRRLIPHVTSDGDYTQPLGVKFDNIVYPPGVVGHRFCHAVRSDNDKTVLDSGWVTRPGVQVNDGVDTIFLDAFQSWKTLNPQTDNIVSFNSANISINSKIYSPDFIKFNKSYQTTGEIKNKWYPRLADANRLLVTFQELKISKSELPARQNYDIDKQFFMEPLSYYKPVDFNDPFISYDPLTSENIIKTDYLLEDIEIALGIDSRDDLLGGKTNSVYAYKKKVAAPYESILNLVYHYINFNPATSLLTEDNVFYSGDILISNVKMVKTDGGAGAAIIGEDSDSSSLGENFITIYDYSYQFEEHEINSSLRHNGYNQTIQFNWALEKLTYNPDAERPALKKSQDVEPEKYLYNKDYTKTMLDNGKVSLPLNFNYCSDCINQYPNRIIWSPKSFEEESFDLYLVNKVNDYIDLPAHRGRITGLVYQNDQLLVHTEDTTFILQPNPQQINTDQVTAYLSTGDFLGIPPRELVQTDVGFGGLQSKQSQCNTPFGHFWADQKRGELLQWNGRQPQVISDKGLEQWFRENLPSEATKLFYDIEGKDFPINSTLDRRGVGVILYYDPRFKRVMITKKDYQALNQDQEFVTPEQTVVWSFSNKLWQAKNESFATITVSSNNPQYFEDKSWTLSYSPLEESFVSWHSYIPRISFSDSNAFYSNAFSTNNSQIFKHLSKNNYQSFYGIKYDFILEYGKFDSVTADLGNVFYVGSAQVWDVNEQVFKNVDSTFDKLLAYNQNQSTGLQTLILQNQTTNPYANNKLSASTKYVIRTDENYKIAGLLDYSTGVPVVTKDWTAKQLYNGYIDVVVNNIDFTKSPYTISKLKSKLLFVRLFFKPAQDYKKTIAFQVVKQQDSIR